MTVGDDDICGLVRAHVTNAGILDGESEIQHATKFSLKSGANRAGLLVYNSGKVVVEGADSELKQWCQELKTSIQTRASAH